VEPVFYFGSNKQFQKSHGTIKKIAHSGDIYNL
jgi:hypothetical protein